MNDLLNEIESALSNKLYLIALHCSLSLPDICGAIQSDDGTASGEKYKKWYDEYAYSKINSNLTSLDCYWFRCSVLHQGSTIPDPKKNKNANYSRIVFVLSDSVFAHNNIIKGALNIDIHIFCRGMIEGVREWQNDMIEKQDENYLKYYDKTIKKYQDGLSPYVLGCEVIS